MSERIYFLILSKINTAHLYWQPKLTYQIYKTNHQDVLMALEATRVQILDEAVYVFWLGNQKKKLSLNQFYSV